MCDDGSYCCNDDALCCSKGEGKFVDPRGNIIPNPYTSQALTPAATTVAITTVYPTPTASASHSDGLSGAAKGAVGALAGVLLITAIAAAFFIRRKRREIRSLKDHPTQIQLTTPLYDHTRLNQKEEMGFGPAEMTGMTPSDTPGPRELAS